MFILDSLVATLLLIGLIWYISFQYRRRRLYKLAKDFNGPYPLPLIGNALKCFVKPTEITDKILEGSACYESPARLWFGPYLIIHVWDPENVQTIINSPHVLGRAPQFAKLNEFMTGRGLLSAMPVEDWRRHRRLISPMFNQKFLEGFFDSFCKHSEKLVKFVGHHQSGEIFNVHDDLARYAMHTIMETLLGYKDDDENSTNINTLLGWFTTMLYSLIQRTTNPLYLSDHIFGITSYGKRIMNIKKQYDGFLHSIIDKWEKITTETHTKTDATDDDYKPKTFIEHLISVSDGSGKFTIEELRGEVNTFIAVSLETTSSSLGYILLALGIYPDVQERVYQEIKQVLGSRKRLEYDDLKRLEYLERVIKEVLRLFPGIAGLARYTADEIQLKSNTIPANTIVVVGLLSLHRNPDIWPEPNKFDPDRFLPEEEAKRHPYAYLPFSAGPRNCIGMRFAWMTLKIAIATFVLNYKITTQYKSIDDIHLTMVIVFKPTDGYRIQIVCRE